MFAELVGFARQVVTVEPVTGWDQYGQKTYGAAVSYRARVSGKRRLVRSDKGDLVVSSHQVYFATTPAITPHDRITLSTGDVNSTEPGARQPAILAVGKFPDDMGGVHLTVYLA